MIRRRFYASRSAFSADQKTVRLAPHEAQHLRDVLRLKRGDQVFVFDGEGKEFHCIIEDSGRDFAQLKVVSEALPARPESPLDLTLAVALLKGEKFDLVVQKATELGVSRILPVATMQSDVRLGDQRGGNQRLARWRRIALEAAKQSGRARVPEVATPIALAALLKTATEDTNASALRDALYLMFAERDGGSLREALSYFSGTPHRVIALVGSEGGWANEEIGQARADQWRIVTLGGRTLRAETAAVAVAVLLQHLFGDLR